MITIGARNVIGCCIAAEHSMNCFDATAVITIGNVYAVQLGKNGSLRYCKNFTQANTNKKVPKIHMTVRNSSDFGITDCV